MGSSRDRTPIRMAANASRRMWAVMGAYAAVAVMLVWAADLPFGVTADNWRAQAWMTLAYVAANAVMTVYRVDRNNALRRTNETLTEMLYVVGLFWLAPGALIVGRVIAAFVAWHFTKMRWQWRLYNSVVYLIASTVLVRAYLWIAPSSPLDGWRAVLVALSVWVLNDVVRVGALFILDWARTGQPRPDVLMPYLGTSYLRGIACAFGLLVAIAFEITPWSLTAVAAVGVLFVMVSKANSRAASLDQGISQISRFSAATADAERPEAVEQELLSSVEVFGRLETVAIAATAKDADLGNAPIEWTGTCRSGLSTTVASTDALFERASEPPRLAMDRRGLVGVWALDPIRTSFLVVESTELTASQSDLWTTVGHLVDHARLAIDTVYKSQRLTDLAEQEYERARVDPLTHLPNRVAVNELLAERLVHSEGGEFSLMLIELIGYQEWVNVLGQDFGDAAVSNFADHLVELARTGNIDLVAHVAASRFVLVVPGSAGSARVVAEFACVGPTLGRVLPSQVDRSRHTAEPAAAYEADPFAQRVALAGIATVRPEMATADEMIRAASIALDRATQDEQIASFGSTDAASAERRMSIRFEIGRAIDDRSVVPEFQPQISLASGLVSGCEVLARWRHSQLGEVCPTEFIPVAEQSGQIDRLTLMIVEQALDAARFWGDEGEPLGLSINISARSLDSPSFVRAFARLVDEVARPTTATTIEITESLLVDRASMMLGLERMRELGFRISIDDFGTGYSALSYLDRLPADEVKVDQSMVRPISPSNPVSPVVNHLIELCQALGLSVCAEGIEDQYQLHVLRSLGCDSGQGYLISGSLTAEAMTTWVTTHRITHASDRTALSSWVELIDP